MNTSKVQSLDLQDITATTSYSDGNKSSELLGRFRTGVGMMFDIDAGAGCTGLVFKAQVETGGEWIDLYRDSGNGTFEVEEYTIPLEDGDSGQKRAIRLYLDSIRNTRFLFKGQGAPATIRKIEFVSEQEHTTQ